MPGSYKVLYRGGEGCLMEKKSKFIATTCPVQSEEEALQFIEAMRKKYWDARHNCFAYVIGERGELQRFSDDGEPQGTAGKPMLDVLLGEGIRNIAVVATRYFGGTLLGTGGLVRAYSGAVREGLASSLIITRIPGVKLHIRTDYTGLGKIQYILGEMGIRILESAYTDEVEIWTVAASDVVKKVIDEITEGTSGRAHITEEGHCLFAEAEGEIIIEERP